MHFGKQSAKLIDLALKHNKTVAEVMILYTDFMRALTGGESEDVKE